MNLKFSILVMTVGVLAGVQGAFKESCEIEGFVYCSFDGKCYTGDQPKPTIYAIAQKTCEGFGKTVGGDGSLPDVEVNVRYEPAFNQCTYPPFGTYYHVKIPAGKTNVLCANAFWVGVPYILQFQDLRLSTDASHCNKVELYYHCVISP